MVGCKVISTEFISFFYFFHFFSFIYFIYPIHLIHLIRTNSWVHMKLKKRKKRKKRKKISDNPRERERTESATKHGHLRWIIFPAGVSQFTPFLVPFNLGAKNQCFGNRRNGDSGPCKQKMLAQRLLDGLEKPLRVVGTPLPQFRRFWKRQKLAESWPKVGRKLA